MAELQDSDCVRDRQGVRYSVRQLQASDLPQLHQLTDAETWSPTLQDLESMFLPQPQAFIAAFTPDNTLISCCMGYQWGDKMAYLGFYITREDYRGRGIGSALFTRVMTSLKDRNVILDAVSSIGLLYRSVGFECSKMTMVKYRGILGNIQKRQMYVPVSVTLQGFQESVFNDVVEYDTQVHYGMERQELLRRWLHAAHVHFLAAYDQDGMLVGYGALRDIRLSSRLAPLYADTQEVAVAILSALIALPPDGTKITCITTSQHSAATCRVLEATGLKPEQYDHETRMFTRQDLNPAPSQVFAVLNTHNALI